MGRRYVKLGIEDGVIRHFIQFKGIKHNLEYRKGNEGKGTGEPYVLINGKERPVESGFRWRFFKKVPARYVDL